MEIFDLFHDLLGIFSYLLFGILFLVLVCLANPGVRVQRQAIYSMVASYDSNNNIMAFPCFHPKLNTAETNQKRWSIFRSKHLYFGSNYHLSFVWAVHRVTRMGEYAYWVAIYLGQFFNYKSSSTFRSAFYRG
jgi:hypothetical protein